MSIAAIMHLLAYLGFRLEVGDRAHSLVRIRGGETIGTGAPRALLSQAEKEQSYG